MSLVSYLKKQGGLNLLKRYIYHKVFFYAIFAFILVQKNRTGLELFRELMENRIYFKMKKKYKKVILSEMQLIEWSEKDIVKPKVIWVCWLQGIENAPALVKNCFETIKEYNPDYSVILLTYDNLDKYISLPEYIIEKWKKGVISNTHFSDILRNNILLCNGGTWVDATLLFTNHIPVDVEESGFFIFQTLKPGRDGKAIPISSWFMSTSPGNPVLKISQSLLFQYWLKNDKLHDYFLFHYFVMIGLELFPEIERKIPKYTNETPHILLFELDKKYEKQRIEKIKMLSFCHKLTYKVPNSVINDQNSVYNNLNK